MVQYIKYPKDVCLHSLITVHVLRKYSFLYNSSWILFFSFFTVVLLVSRFTVQCWVHGFTMGTVNI